MNIDDPRFELVAALVATAGALVLFAVYNLHAAYGTRWLIEVADAIRGMFP